MNAKPQLLCWLMCDNVHVDPSTGKHYILGIFSNIRVRQFPAVHPRMVWFLSLTDVPVGKHSLKISIGLTMEASQKLVEHQFESRSPLHSINLINELKNLPFPQEGRYAITIEVDGDPVLVSNLNVAGPQEPSEPPQE